MSRLFLIVFGWFFLAQPAIAQIPGPPLRLPDPTPAVVEPKLNVAQPPSPLERNYLDNSPVLSGTQLPPPISSPLFERPWHPEPPPSAISTSACNFDHLDCGNIFSPDYTSIQVLVGNYYSTRRLGAIIPAFNYVPLTIRYNIMLTAPQNTTWFWRGNWEQIFELSLAGITSSYGNFFAGPSGLLKLRYNFVQDDWKLVPYVQAGSGFIFTDAYRDQTQRAIGSAFEFHLQVEAGVRCFLSQYWSIDLEGGLQHISNASTAKRNHGVNAFGIQLGITYHFPVRH